MKKNLFYIIIIGLMCFTNGYSEEKEPKWIENPPTGIYVGVSKIMESEQEARIDAIKDGKRQIIATLGGLIETEFIDRLVENGENNSGSFTDSKVKIVAKNILSVKADDIYIKKIEQKTGFMKKKMVYQAYAAIAFSKIEHDKFMDELVAETEMVSRSRFQELQKSVESGQFIFALSELIKIPDEYESIINITGLTPSQLGVLKKLDQDVLGYISELRGNVFISSDKQKYLTKMNKPLKETLDVSVYFEKSGKKIPIKSADVEFEAISGKIEFNSTGKTDDQGIASCKVNEVSCNDKSILRATVKFPKETMIDPLIYNFYLLPDNKISIKIAEKNLDEVVQDSYLENNLIQKFTEMNFQVVDSDFLDNLTADKIDLVNAAVIANTLENSSADFLVFGRVIIDRTNKYREGIHFAWAKASVKIYDVEKMEIIESIIQEEKGAGNSDKDAGVKAIKKVSEIVTNQLINKINNEGQVE